MLKSFKKWLVETFWGIKCPKHPDEYYYPRREDECWVCVKEGWNKYYSKIDAKEREARIQEMAEAMIRADNFYRKGTYR